MSSQSLAARGLMVCFAAAVAAAAPLALAQTAKPSAQAYKAPRNAFGQPDFGGAWSNATITPTTRVSSFGTRSIYTPDEVKQQEGAQAASVVAGNQPIDNSKPLTDGVILAHGGVGIAGNYDRGWFEPGSLVMRVHGEARNSLLTTPNGQVPPRKGALAPVAGAGRAPLAAGRPAGAPARAAATDNPETMAAGDRCLISFGRNAGPPMLPNGFYNNNYQIQQGRDAVAILSEMVHDTRIVRLNSTHRTDGVRPWFGDSIGHYEGETLVVETTNIPQTQAYNGSWEHLTVTEKFTRVARDRLLYQFSIHDPTLWDADWGGEYEFSATSGVYEYACHEGNYAMEDMLAGARAQDRAAAARR